jgi:hypothetical protein
VAVVGVVRVFMSASSVLIFWYGGALHLCSLNRAQPTVSPQISAFCYRRKHL